MELKRKQLLADKQATETIINHCKIYAGIDLSELDKDLQDALVALYHDAIEMNKEINNRLK